jgi:NDP-sugar pyrophosphorylase family protein
MTDLIEKLLSQDRPIVSFPIVEYWLDIGRMADFERAQEDIKNMRQAA